MALLEKLSGSCQGEKINAWLGSPGGLDPPSPFLSSLPISPPHHPHTANSGMSHANVSDGDGAALNAAHTFM